MAHHRDDWIVWVMIGLLIVMMLVIAAFIHDQNMRLYLDLKKEFSAPGEIRK